MKRLLTTAAALALMTGAATAQTDIQPSDPEQAQRRGTIAQPPGQGEGPAGANQSGSTTAVTPGAGSSATPNAAEPKGGRAAGTTVQPSDPEESQRKGAINQPGATVTR
jgi:hypothetical protein